MDRRYLSTLIFIMSFAPGYSKANVDPFSGRLAEEFIDFEIEGFQITRSTAAGPTAKGLFGRSWCTNLDAQLDIEKSLIELRLCNEELPLIYTRNNKGVFVSKDEREFIEQSQNGWTRVRPGFFEEMFDSSGQLLGLRTSSSEFKIQRTDREIQVNFKNSSEPIVMKLGKNKTIESIQFKNTQVFYTYDKTGRLAEVKNMWDSVIKHKYNSNSRLTEVRLKAKDQKEKVISVSYDGPTERVREARLINDCVISAKYEKRKDEASQQIQFENEFTERCPNSPIVKKNFRRTVKSFGTTEQALLEESFKSETRSWQRSYDLKNGRVVSFEENGKAATVTRNSRHQVTQIAYSDGRTYNFLYDKKCGRVRSYTTSGGKKSRIEMTLSSSCQVEGLRIGNDHYELGQYVDPQRFEFVKRNGKTIRPSDLSQPRSRIQSMSDQIAINAVDEALHWSQMAESM